MTDQAASRVLLDQCGPGNLIVSTPQSTVFVNLQVAGIPEFCLAVTEGSIMRDGSIIPTCDTTVFIENLKMANEGTASNTGVVIGKSSPNVFVGKG
jgi:hypothetical protein